MINVIIPANNEARVLGRLLNRLTADASPDELDVVVVANGCTDDTATIAAGFGSPVRVITMAAASKPQALAVGDGAVHGYPRVYLDADVELGIADLRLLAAELQHPGVLAAAPEREFAMDRRSWVVRWFYDVWIRLPEVQRGLFGRGVIAVNEAGHERITGLQQVVADDLAVSLSFAPSERAIATKAMVLIHPPRTVADLLRRRVRVAEGISQLSQMADMPKADASRTRSDNLLSMLKRNPAMAPRVGLFLVIGVVARLRASRTRRRGDYSVWHRDESSRK